MREVSKGNSGNTAAIPQPHGGVLRPFQPGQSGNPSGRPLGRRNLSTIIKDLLEQQVDFSKLDTEDAARLAEMYEGKSAWEAVVRVATIKALQGNIKAADFLARNAYGTRQIIETDPLVLPMTPDLENEIERELEITRLGEQALAARESQKDGDND